MKKLTIFSLIIVSTLASNVEAMEPQTFEEIRIEEMRERAQEVVAEYNKILAIEDQSEKLEALEDLENRADDTLDFLRRNQQYGMGGLRGVRQILNAIERAIKQLRSELDIGVEEMDIDDSD